MRSRRRTYFDLTLMRSRRWLRTFSCVTPCFQRTPAVENRQGQVTQVSHRDCPLTHQVMQVSYGDCLLTDQVTQVSHSDCPLTHQVMQVSYGDCPLTDQVTQVSHSDCPFTHQVMQVSYSDCLLLIMSRKSATPSSLSSIP